MEVTWLLLFYAQYHACGEGVMEVTWLMHNLALPLPLPRLRQGRHGGDLADAQPCFSTPGTTTAARASWRGRG